MTHCVDFRRGLLLATLACCSVSGFAAPATERHEAAEPATEQQEAVDPATEQQEAVEPAPEQRQAVEPATESLPLVTNETTEELPPQVAKPDDSDTPATLSEQRSDSVEGSHYGSLPGDGIVLDRLEARRSFWDYFNADEYEQAVDAGELTLKLTEEKFGPDDLEVAPVLDGLGAALAKVDRPADAEPLFERSIAIYRDKIGIFAPAQVAPLMGLGLAQQKLGDHDAAQLSFKRAQYVLHRDKGVNNLDQIPIIQARAQSYMAQDKWLEAENLQLLAFNLYRRNYGKGDPKTIPAMYALARWYQDIMDYRQARIIYRKTLEMLEEDSDHDTPAMVPALKGLAAAYLEERSADMDKGLRAHKRIVAIADEAADYDPERRIVAHLELGDWYVMFNKEDEAWEQYRIGWELSVARGQDSNRDWLAYFDRPHLIYPGVTLSVDFMGYGVVGKEVYYDFQFTIARDGRPKEIDVLGTNLHGQTRSAAIQAFRYARFRPRIVDGATVATPGYKVRRVYPTLPPDDYHSVNLGGGQRLPGQR